jgi:hypothetical protein
MADATLLRAARMVERLHPEAAVRPAI